MSEPGLPPDELLLLEQTLRKTMQVSGSLLDESLVELGWRDMLAEIPDVAVPLVFRLLGETGAHAPVLNDVLAHAAGEPLGETTPLPFTGGNLLVWERSDRAGTTVDEELPLHSLDAAAAENVAGGPLSLEVRAAGRRALAWWLVGSSRAMLTLARRHALERTQFGRPVAGFQAVRHRLAEAFVAIEAAEAALTVADSELGALLAKAAAGRAANVTSRHCQQVLGGIGFTAEHDLHRHVRRVLVLDGLLGSTRELVREAGFRIREAGAAPRLAQL